MRHGTLKTACVALAVSIGGFLLGFDTAVISGVAPFIRDEFGLSGSSGDLRLGWAVSSLGWGAIAGNAMAGPLSDRFGRWRVLLGTALLFLFSSLLAASALSFTGFVSARIAGGIAVGIAILIAPVYIAEIAPAGKRGSLVSLNQLMIVIGISASFFSNYVLLDMGEHNWRWMLGVQSLPAVLYCALLLFVPESPRWLVMTGRRDEALRILTRLSGQSAAQETLRNISDNVAPQPGTRRFRELFAPRVRHVMLIALGLAFFQQITGINAIFYYLPILLGNAGGGLEGSLGQTALVGLVNLGMTLVAIRFVDRLGRRPLLLAGIGGMALSLFVIGWASSQASTHVTLVLIAIMGFVASFAVSLGPVMWVLLSEIFPNEYRAAAISVVGLWNSLVSASITFIFPQALSTLGAAGTFFSFGLMASAAVVFVLLFVPETKGRTLEELSGDLTPAKGASA